MNIKKHRENRKISQKEIAAKLGMTQQAYSLKENQKRQFTIEEALLLEEILGVSIRELFKNDK